MCYKCMWRTQKLIKQNSRAVYYSYQPVGGEGPLTLRVTRLILAFNTQWACLGWEWMWSEWLRTPNKHHPSLMNACKVKSPRRLD